MYKKTLNFFLIVFFCFFFAKNIYALNFDLVAPSGELQRGQEVKFTINIDTEEKSYSSTQIGMTYETQYLEYVSVSPGDAFTTVSTTPAGDGKIIITGSSSSPYSGSGVFAYVTFKIIAAGPGSTQLCALFNPEITPTSPPNPTALPTTGVVANISQIILGSVFLALASAGFIIFKKL